MLTWSRSRVGHFQVGETTVPAFWAIAHKQCHVDALHTPTWAEFDRVHGLLTRATAATDRYRDFTVAVKDGYASTSLAFVRGQGYHYLNPAYLDRGFDLLHSAFLVYDKVHGHLVLQGLMYYLPARTTAQQLAAIFPPSLASWRRRLNLCLHGGAVLPAYTAAACAQQSGDFRVSRHLLSLHM